MRRWLAVLLFLLPIEAQAAVTATFRGQGANAASAAPTHVFSGAVALHDVGFLLVQNRTDETTTITSVTDTSSNTWISASASSDGDGMAHTGGTTQATWLFVCLDMAAGTPTVTINFSGSISSTYAAIIFTGAKNSGQPDTTDDPPNLAADTALASATIVPATSGMVLAAVVTTGGVTSSGTTAGYTQQTTAGASRVHMWTKDSTAAGNEAISSTWSVSTGWIAWIVNIAPSATTGNQVGGIFMKGIGR